MAFVFGCHCNGLVFETDFGRTFMLCNPAIKEYRAIPEPCHGERGFMMLGVGLGYDSRANDYKVVVFGSYSDTLKHPKAKVYSLESDSWREIGINLQFDGLPFPDKAVFCKGVFYWSMWVKNKKMIISFDLFDEVFHHVSLPDNLTVTREKPIKLAVWNESVALFFYPVEKKASLSVEVWVLDDCVKGVKGSCSWIKKLSIGPLYFIVNAWTFWKNDELLLEDIGGRLISYNLCSQRLRKLTIRGGEHLGCWEFSYLKSLVSLQGGNQSR